MLETGSQNTQNKHTKIKSTILAILKCMIQWQNTLTMLYNRHHHLIITILILLTLP